MVVNACGMTVLTVYRIPTARFGESTPRQTKGPRDLQPSGSDSGPGMGDISWYAICRRRDGGSGRVLGT